MADAHAGTKRSGARPGRPVPRARARTGALIGLLVVGLAGGCRTPASSLDLGSRDPSEQLAVLLGAWESTRREGSTCQQRKPAETPLVDCERLRKQIERLSIEFPNDPDVLLANAVVAFESGRREEAEKDLDVLRRIDPIRPEAALLRARIAASEGNLRLAGRVLDEQIELTPDHAGLYELSSSVLYLEERWSEATRELETASRLGAPAWRVAYHRGLILEGSGRRAEAADAYRVCVELEPDFAPARSRLRGLAVLDGLPR